MPSSARPSGLGHGPAAAVALFSRDPRLTADVTRLCSAAAFELHVATDRAEALRCWRSAPLVLIDADLVEDLLAGPTPRRADVMLLADDVDRIDVWRAAARLGVEQVLTLPADDRLLLDRLAEVAERDGETSARTLGVVAGNGGAGASTLAVSICVAVAQTASAVTLLDADPAGGGVDLLLGAESVVGARWPDLAGARGVVAAEALDEALPRAHGVRFLSCDRGMCADLGVDAMSAVLPAARRSSGLVVVDLPRRLGPAAQVAAAACDRLLVVTTARVRAAAATAHVVAALTGLCTDVALVVRTHPRCRLHPAEVSAALGLPLAGVMETDEALAASADYGDLTAAVRRSRLAHLAGELADYARAPRRAA